MKLTREQRFEAEMLMERITDEAVDIEEIVYELIGLRALTKGENHE